MRLPSEKDLLLLWERGDSRHPIDRALLLCNAARPDLASETLAGLPLGRVNAELLRLRAAMFGDRLLVQAACENCQEVLEMPLRVEELLKDAKHEAAGPIFCQGYSFRQPTSRDLAEVVDHLDAESAAVHLLEACWVDRPEGERVTQRLLAEVDALLEQGDPLADPQLVASCPACGWQISVVLDPGQLLWDEVREQARQLIAQVHILAKAYGWTESEVLALSPRRRRMYLELTEGG